eukprot:m.143022 g.143022  ORF g.143022 m.143022 type:complete len:238 (-) comp30286_c5_seq1:69-782(-)
MYVNHSIVNAHGNETRAKAEYEAGAQKFMLATIAATKQVCPLCKVGWYGYPVNALPHIATPQWNAYCKEHVGRCFFDRGGPSVLSGYLGDGGDHQRYINDGLTWLFEALDVITPSVYLGMLPTDTTLGNNTAYVNSTITEAVRLAKHVNRDVIAITWMFYDNYWQTPPPAPRTTLSMDDLRAEMVVPLRAGASGLLLWGAVSNDNSTMGPHAVQDYIDHTLSPIVEELCTEFTCAQV